MTDADELSRLVAEWAAQQRLSDAHAVELRARVLASVEPEADQALSTDRRWSLLRPVTRLLDQLDDDPPTPFPTRWTATYLQLA